MSACENDSAQSDYDADAFLGVLAMIVAEYPEKGLMEIWALIDWSAIRLQGETREEYADRTSVRMESVE